MSVSEARDYEWSEGEMESRKRVVRYMEMVYYLAHLTSIVLIVIAGSFPSRTLIVVSGCFSVVSISVQGRLGIDRRRIYRQQQHRPPPAPAAEAVHDGDPLS